MTGVWSVRSFAGWMGVAAVSLACGCSGLVPKPVAQPAYYSLDGARPPAPSTDARQKNTAMTDLTLIVSPPHAGPGFDTQHIIYVRQAHKREFFANSVWVDTPSRMIGPLILAGFQSRPGFSASVLGPSAVAGDIRLETEIVRLQHNFDVRPSQVRFTLQATFLDNRTRRVLGWREFDHTVDSASEDPYGGVVAAHRAVQVVIADLVGFGTEAAARWQLLFLSAPKRPEK